MPGRVKNGSLATVRDDGVVWVVRHVGVNEVYMGHQRSMCRRRDELGTCMQQLPVIFKLEHTKEPSDPLSGKSFSRGGLWRFEYWCCRGSIWCYKQNRLHGTTRTVISSQMHKQVQWHLKPRLPSSSNPPALTAPRMPPPSTTKPSLKLSALSLGRLRCAILCLNSCSAG